MFLRREAIACGYTDKMLASLRRHGVLRPRAPGCLLLRRRLVDVLGRGAAPVLARAVLRTTPGPVALSHTTALLVHGVAVWGADLTRVHVTRLDDGRRPREADVEHHVGLRARRRRRRGGRYARRGRSNGRSSRRRPCSGSSRRSCPPMPPCTRGAARPTGSTAGSGEMDHWPGSRKIHMMLGLMDGRAESVGETRSRFLFRRPGTSRARPAVRGVRRARHARRRDRLRLARAHGVRRVRRQGQVPALPAARARRLATPCSARRSARTSYGGSPATAAVGSIWGDLVDPRETAAYFRRAPRTRLTRVFTHQTVSSHTLFPV